MLGGRDKGLDFKELISYIIKDNVKKIILFGEARDKIEADVINSVGREKIIRAINYLRLVECAKQNCCTWCM